MIVAAYSFAARAAVAACGPLAPMLTRSACDSGVTAIATEPADFPKRSLNGREYCGDAKRRAAVTAADDPSVGCLKTSRPCSASVP